MKIDLTRSLSLLPSRFEVSLEKRDIRSGEAGSVAREKDEKTEASAREVATSQVTVNNFNVRLKFQIDKETGERVIQIVDSESGELVRQIPPEELLHVIKTLENLKGLLFSTIS
jgi:flagellar protein FlaG